jgi:hypothetical protein
MEVPDANPCHKEPMVRGDHFPLFLDPFSWSAPLFTSMASLASNEAALIVTGIVS